MLVAINRSFRRLRFLPVAALLVLAIALTAAHGAIGANHMSSPGGHTMDPAGHVVSAGQDPAAGQDSSEPSLVTMCLAIVQTAALLAGALATAVALAALYRFALLWLRRAGVHLPVPFAATTRRARPPDLVALQVCVR